MSIDPGLIWAVLFPLLVAWLIVAAVFGDRW